VFITAGWLNVDGVNYLIGDFERVGISGCEFDSVENGVLVGGVEGMDCRFKLMLCTVGVLVQYDESSQCRFKVGGSIVRYKCLERHAINRWELGQFVSPRMN
jgi:hypothetical protein